MKKLLAMLLAFIMVFCLVACGSAGETQTDAEQPSTVEGRLQKFASPDWDGSLPLVKEGEDNVITVGVQANANVTSFDDNKYTLWLEEQTGVDLQFVQFPGTSKDAATQVSLMVAGGEQLPDVLYCFSGIKATAKEYVQDGYFLDLKPYFATNAHYTVAAMDAYYGEDGALREETENYIISVITDATNDAIVGFPTVYNNPSDNTMGHYWINQKWLDTLGLAMPTTTEELYNVLVAFRDGDPNGNGQKDELPILGLADKDQYNILQWITNAFIYEYDMYKFNVEDNVVSAPYDQPEYRQALIFIKKLVDEGLLNTMAWTITPEELKSLMNPTDDMYTVGVLASPGERFESGKNGIYDYVPISTMADATGRGGWMPMTVDRTSYGTYITADCANPTLAFRLLDFMASGESYIRQRWGEFGVDWQFAADGNTLPGMLGGEARIEVMNFNTYSEVNNQNWHSNSLLASEGYWQYALDMDNGSWDSQLYKQLQTNLRNYNEGRRPQQVFYAVQLTADNETAFLDADASIVDYYRTSRANFCTGVWDPADDAQWQTYIDGLTALGYYDVWLAAAQNSWDMSH